MAARASRLCLRGKLFVLAVALCGLVTSAPPAGAQMRVQPVAGREGDVGVGLMLRKLSTTGTFMMVTAHPDDENNAVLAMLGYGRGMRTALVTATRGGGGQNAIGQELFGALGVLRTEELLAAHRFDGAEQYFTRAVDFGYSFSIEETFARWGRGEILGDFVRLIRTIRPDVIVGLRPDGRGGGQHHQASAVLAREAFRAAADPARFPAQLAEGLRPWQAKKFYFSAGFSTRGAPAPPADAQVIAVDVGGYDSLLGRSYAELGSEARSMHKCQGVSQLLDLPRSAVARYDLADTIIPDRMSVQAPALFDGIDTTVAGLWRYAGRRPPPELLRGLDAIERFVQDAQQRFDHQGVAATRGRLLAGLSAVRNLRDRLRSLALDARAVYEIDLRLATKEAQFERAVVLAHGVRVEALADDGMVTAGQPVRVSALVANRGTTPIAVRRVSFAGFAGTGLGCGTDVVAGGAVYSCASTLAIPSDAPPTAPYFTRLPDAARYAFDSGVPFGLPFRPSPFQATFAIEFGSERVAVQVPVHYRYEKAIFSGEKRMELEVVPVLAVQLSPAIAVVPLAGGDGASRDRDVRVVVTNRGRDPIDGRVTLTLPDGWRAEPAEVPLAFGWQDEERTARFTVTPAPSAPPGEYAIHARAATATASFDQASRVVEYPHIHPRSLLVTAQGVIKLIDVRVAPDLLVGYIMGTGDEVPDAITELGASLVRLGADDLGWGDLSRYDVIVTGVRAYEHDPALRAHNDRLLAYVEHGGTLVVQYNKFGFNDAQYGPYPARVTRNRITDEHAPVEILVPDHPVFTFPNRLDEATWSGWIQERGLYFLGARAPEYVDLMQMEDPFEYNAGVKRGALVEGRIGKGRWLYVGLALWRQLPAGTEGAYRLLANLISLGKAPGPAE